MSCDLSALDGFRSCLVPRCGVFRKPCALDAHDTETLTSRRAHDHPSFHARIDLGAELLEPLDFSGNVVGLNVDVSTALMFDELDLHAC
jgi:hypothetical protein